MAKKSFICLFMRLDVLWNENIKRETKTKNNNNKRERWGVVYVVLQV